MSDGGKGDKRRPGDDVAFADNFKKVFGDKKPVRGRFVFDKELGEMVPYEDYEPPSHAAPMVMGDIQPYQSQATGEYITSRSRHREHLKANRLIEVGNETKYLKPPPKTLPPGLKERLIYEVNKRF